MPLRLSHLLLVQSLPADDIQPLHHAVPITGVVQALVGSAVVWQSCGMHPHYLHHTTGALQVSGQAATGGDLPPTSHDVGVVVWCITLAAAADAQRSSAYQLCTCSTRLSDVLGGAARRVHAPSATAGHIGVSDGGCGDCPVL